MKQRSGQWRPEIVWVGVLFAGMFTPTALGQEFSAQAVEKSVDAGVRFLLSKQQSDGGWGPFGDEENKDQGHGWYPTGPTALATYALLESGMSPSERPMVKALNWLAEHETDKTYCLGIRANVWLVANRKTLGKYRKHLAKDVTQLLRSTTQGYYTYVSDKTPVRDRWDNSNSQYGLLGVWAGAQDNLEIPQQYWVEVFNHWRRTQSPDGGWSYKKAIDPASVPKELHQAGGTLSHKLPRATMTTAGLASVFVCIDNLFANRFAECRGKTDIPCIRSGLDWMDRHFPETIKGSPNVYYLYGVERVGLASGYKYFGTQDWYKQGALQLMNHQQGGAWNQYSPVVGTSLGLLFLIRGQHPVAFNKLEFHGDWNNRPRDLASLTRWMSNQFERTFHWQIINLRISETELHDAPILYLSGSQIPTFTDEETDKLRRFVYQGGTLLSVTECNGSGFRKGIRDLYKTLFPKYELTPLPADHPIYDNHFKLHGRPTLYEISNGVRPLAIHSDEDLARAWQLRQTATAEHAFLFGGNLLLYVVGEFSDLRPRGALHWPAEPVDPNATAPHLRIARIRFPGNWDPEPLVYERLERMVAPHANLAFQTLTLEELPQSGVDLALLTGTGSWTPGGKELALLKTWLHQGGTLLVDAAGGDETFAKASRDMLAGLFGRDNLLSLPTDAALYSRKGLNIRKVRYRKASKKRIGNYQNPLLKGVPLGDRYAVLYSREDITTGLGGFPSGTVDGYDPDIALDLMRNIILYTVDHLPEDKTKPVSDSPPENTGETKSTDEESLDIEDIFE